MGSRRLAGGFAVALAIVALAGAFAWPYRGSADAPAPPVRALLGPLDGAGRLTRIEDPDGSTRWTSVTVQRVPDTLVASFSGDVLASIVSRLGKGAEERFLERGELPGADVYRDEVAERTEDGPGGSRASLTVLDDDGLGYVASFFGDGTTEVYDPPLPILPRDPRPGSEWEATGTVGSGLRYAYSGEVLADERSGDAGIGPDARCVVVASVLRIDGDGAEGYEQSGEERWCEGRGSVRFEQEVPAGTVAGTLVSLSGFSPIDAPPERALPTEAAPAELGEDEWVRSSVVAPLSGVVTPSPSLQPAVVEGDDPVVLVGTLASPSVQAIRAVPGDGSSRAWTAATRSIPFGSPLVDTASGRVFVGSASGEVRALTSDGLFLWSTDVGDNVATRPALADGTLVVGSEDGRIIGLDPASGADRWSVETGGPVVSWPAAGHGLVVVGSDDGIVRAIDPGDGSVEWSYEAAGPVEAPIVATDGGFVVADRAGDLALVDPRGAVRWSETVGGGLRTLPLVSGSDVVVVAEGAVVAMDLDTGTERWRRTGDHVGPVAAIGGRASVVAATDDGDLVAYDDEGREVERWDPPAGLRVPGSEASFDIGPVVGAGAVWVVDDVGRVQRLGPALAGVAEERAPRWAASVGLPPFDGSSLRTTPLIDGGDGYVIDHVGTIYPLDAATGPLEAAGQLTLGEGDGVTIGGVAGDGTGYLATGSKVQAFDLPRGEQRWEATVPGQVYRPPVLAEDVLLVASEEAEVHHLTAFEVATGERRWTEETGVSPAPGALLSPVLVVDDLVIAGDPISARSLEDGATEWTADANGALGGAVRLPTGEVAATITEATDDGSEPSTIVVALDAVDGSEVGRVELDGVLGEGLVSLLHADGLVIVQDGGRRSLTAVDPIAGEERWETTLPADRLGGAAVLEDGLVWVALTDGRVLALDPLTGEELVRTSELGVDLADGSLVQAPAQAGDTVVVAAGLLLLGIPAGAP